MDWRYEELFDSDPKKGLQQSLTAGVTLQRTKTVKAGQMLYFGSYPIWNTEINRKANAEKAKRGATSKHQKIVNARNAQLKLEQMINANFGTGDLMVTCTYRPESMPETLEQARKDARNYIRRVRTLRERRGLGEVKYVCVTETQETRKGVRFHHHIILTGEGVTRDEMEECWHKVHGGAICNTEKVQAQREGLTGYAKYITKQISGDARDQKVETKRRWYASRNLVKPKETKADHKISRRRVERIATTIDGNLTEARHIFELMNPGYELLECQVRTSAFVPGAYIYARMCKKEGQTCSQRSSGKKKTEKQGSAMPTTGNTGKE